MAEADRQMKTRIGLLAQPKSMRSIIDANLWYDDFKLRRAEDDAKPDAVRKGFNRARDWLQANDYIREYENKIWCIDDPDRQDK